MKEIKVDFEKYIYDKDEKIFKMIKTKTNKYILIDCKTKQIIANNKNEILMRIKEYKEQCQN